MNLQSKMDSASVQEEMAKVREQIEKEEEEKKKKDELARLREQSQALRSRVDDEENVKKQLGWTKAVKQEILEKEEKDDRKKKDEQEKNAAQKEDEEGKSADQKPAVQEPPKPACNRRQTAMFLNRLRKNPKRRENLPEGLKEKLAKEDDDSVSELITQLMEHGGDLQELCSSYERQVVKEVSSQELTNSAPFTELELVQKYGERAKNVMKEKEASGDWAEDPNLRGSKIFYLCKTERTIAHDIMRRLRVFSYMFQVSCICPCLSKELGDFRHRSFLGLTASVLDMPFSVCDVKPVSLENTLA